MSEKEIQQLKDLIFQTLETTGQLSSIKAQVRQTVFNAIDNPQESTNKTKKYQTSQSQQKQSQLFLKNKKILNITEDEKMTINLIKELLLHYEMDYSYNIISNESNLLQDVNRNDLSTKLKLNKGEKMPLLVQILQNHMNNSNKGTQNNNNNNNINKFSKYDNNQNNIQQNDIEESIKFEEITDDEDKQKKKVNKNKKNPLASSVEDTIGASVSQGQDQSVDSLELEEYDYYENAR